MYGNETSFSNPVQRSVEKFFVFKLHKFDEQKTSENDIKKHSSNNLLRQEAKAIPGHLLDIAGSFRPFGMG